MPKLTEHMKQLIQEQPIVYVATVDEQQRPNVSPKGAVLILDDEQLVFADLFSLKTRANLTANPCLAVAVVNPQAYEGYQFKGQAQMLDSGPLYDQVSELLARSRYGREPMELWFEKAVNGLLAAFGRAGRPSVQPRHAVVVHIDEIWNLAPGHEGEVWR